MPSNDSSFEELDPAKYPTPAPGTGQTSVIVGIDPSDESEPVSNPLSWSTLSTFQKGVTIMISLIVSVALVYAISAFIASRFFH